MSALDDAAAQAHLAALAGRGRGHRTGPPGDRLAWREWGPAAPSRTPVVLLHGGSGSWTHWVHTLPALWTTRRVLAVDLPGLGDSDLPPEAQDGDSLARRVALGMAELLSPDEPRHLVGFSFGGIVAGHLAAQGVHGLGAVVLIGSPPFGLPDGGPANEVRAVPVELSLDEARSLHEYNLRTLMFADAGVIDALCLRIHHDNLIRARLRSRRIARNDGLAQAIRRFQGRLHGIWGEHDVTVHPDLATVQGLFLDRRGPGGFDLVAGAGHWLMYEAPEAFNALLARRLEEADA